MNELREDLRTRLRPAPGTSGADGSDAREPGSPDEEAVLALLDPVEPLQIDRLADTAPFGIARLQVALFGLEVRGVIESLPGAFYRRR